MLSDLLFGGFNFLKVHFQCSLILEPPNCQIFLQPTISHATKDS